MTALARSNSPLESRPRPPAAFRLCWLACLFYLIAASHPARAAIRLDDGGKLELYGDFRLRFESDWDSRRPDGSLRPDRDRLRIRGRLGLDLKPTSEVTLGVRLRTGSWESQQSPHITFHDFDRNSTGDKDLVLDRWFFQFRREATTLWLGRDGYPFWKQNELFWDDDATLAGATLRQRFRSGDSSLELIGGFYFNSDGMDHFVGNMEAVQAVYTGRAAGVNCVLASGVFFLQGGEGAKYLTNNNGGRDYKIWQSNAQFTLPTSVPVRLGVDFMYNFEDYSADDPDPFTASHHDEKTGVVAQVTLGQTREPWDWSVAYYYSWIQTFALDAAYAQDDWVRWGSATQTDSSDMKGHELRWVMALPKRANLMARLYLVEAISSAQDGKRFRLDVNWGF